MIVEALKKALSFGESTPDRAIAAGVPSSAILRQQALAERLADFLPWVNHDPDTGIYENDGSYGFALECPPIPGANEDVAKAILGLFQQNYPENATIQVTLWSSPETLPLMQAWASKRKEDIDQAAEEDGARQQNVYRRMARRRVDYYLKGRRRSMFRDRHFLVRDFRLVFSVMFPGKPDHAGTNKLIAIRDGFSATLKAAGLWTRELRPEALLTLLDEILNPREEPRRELRAWDQDRPISEQAVDIGTRVVLGSEGMTINDRSVRSFSVRDYPREWSLAMMGDLIGDSMQGALQIPCPFLFSCGIRIPNTEEVRRKAQLKAARAITNAESPMAKFMPDMMLKAQEWRAIQGGLDAGLGLVEIYHQLTLFTDLNKGDQASNAAEAVFRSKGWAIRNDRFMQIQGFLANLPLSYDCHLADDMRQMKRTRTLTEWNAVQMLPVVGEWQGTDTPTMMFLGRRGQLMFFDPFDNKQGNYNVAIAATSGAGKSFLLNEIATSTVGSGGRCWIIDVGRSYERTCKLLGGQFIEFSEQVSPVINPFTHITSFDDDEVVMLKQVVAQAAAPSRPLNDLENAWIEQALYQAWRSKGSKATFTTVADFLLSNDDVRARDLGNMLFPYTKDGVYAKFFEGDATLNFNSDFVVLELEELKSRKDLQSVVLLIVMLRISNEMYLGERDRRKICIIDEAWDLMGGGTAAQFIETGYRRVRKYGGSFMTATQSVNDYYANDGSRAAWENSDWVLLLRQKPESIEQLKDSGRMVVDGYLERLLRSVHTVHGEYSEIFIKGPGIGAIGRLVTDPYTSFAYSTKAEEYNRARQLMSQGMSLADAIELMVQEKERRDAHH